MFLNSNSGTLMLAQIAEERCLFLYRTEANSQIKAWEMQQNN